MKFSLNHARVAVSRYRTSYDWIHIAIVTAIIAFGSYLRLSGLSRESLWFDEADIVVRAQRPWSDILSTFTVQGENGPLYNVLLAAWIRVAGISEAAVRFPSAIAGICGLLAIYVLGRRLAGRQVGMITTALLAISPYHLWYSQEAKMYSIVALFSIVSTLLLVEALGSRDRRLWIAYVVVTTFMFYTHVASVLIFVAQAVFVAATLRSWSSNLRSIAVAGAALTVPYIPIAVWAARVVGGEVPTWHNDFSFVEAFRTIGIKFSTFESTPEIEFRAGLVYAITAVLSAAWLLARPARRTVGVLLVSLTLLPILGIWIVSLRNSVFADRYIIGALPAYLLIVAIGLGQLNRIRGGFIPVVLVATVLTSYSWFPITEVNRASTAQKEDWRSAYARVAERAAPDDVFLVHPGYMISTLAYYGQRDNRLGGHPVGTIPAFAPDWMTREVMVELLRDEFARFTRFWLIESPERVLLEDPDNELADWFIDSGTIIYQDRVNGVRLTLFELPADW